MSWSVSLGRVAGSDIRIHLTFLLLLAWIGIVHWQQGGAAAALDGIVFVIAVFACVTLHELGHALAARRYGIRTPDITLLPIGGVARLERMPEDPGQEIVIAVAGPLVNVVIAAVLIVYLGSIPDFDPVTTLQDPAYGFVARVAAVNVLLVLFNLIPAFPMDGGRVFRAVLSYVMPRVRATQIAARVGQGAAFVFAFIGLVGGNPILVLIAVFIYLAAAAEAEGTGMLEMARRLRGSDAMVSAFETLGVNATLDDAADALLRTTQHEFPVVDGSGKLRGMLTRDVLFAALREQGPAAPARDVMTTGIPEFPASARLDKVLEAMQQGGQPAVALTGPDGRFAGYVSRENLLELTLLTSANWPAGHR